MDRSLESHWVRQDLRYHRPARSRSERISPGAPDQRQHPRRSGRSPQVSGFALPARYQETERAVKKAAGFYLLASSPSLASCLGSGSPLYYFVSFVVEVLLLILIFTRS